MRTHSRRLLTLTVPGGLACGQTAPERPTLEDVASELLGRTTSAVRSAFPEARDSTWDLGYGDPPRTALSLHVRGIGVLALPCLSYEFADPEGTAIRGRRSTTGPIWRVAFDEDGTVSGLGVSVGSSLGDLREQVDSIAVALIEGEGFYAHVPAGEGRYAFLLDRFDVDALRRGALWENGTLLDPGLVPDSALLTEISLAGGDHCADIWRANQVEWERRR